MGSAGMAEPFKFTMKSGAAVFGYEFAPDSETLLGGIYPNVVVRRGGIIGELEDALLMQLEPLGCVLLRCKMIL